MRTQRLILVCLCTAVQLAGGLLSGCGPRGLELDAENDGGSATMQVGGTLTLRLQSSPTTGYGWEFVGLEEQDVLTLTERTFKSDSMLLGAGGVDTFRLVAAAAGEADFELVYRRAWEPDEPPLKTFTFHITAR